MILLELVSQIGLNPKWKAGTHGGEYSSECPSCGGEDRFFIQPNRRMKNCVGYYKCRQCEISGDSIQFCIDFLGYTFKEAVQRVGAKISETNLNYPQYKVNKFKPVKLIAPSAEWIDKAKVFVEWCHAEVWKYSDILTFLNKRGLPKDAIIKYKIGYNPNTIFRDRSSWGLVEEKDEKGNTKKLWLPAGIVIPSIELNGDVTRLKIRRTDWNENDSIPKYIAVTGSMNGLNLIGDLNNRIMVIVESELDQFVLDYCVGDIAFFVAVGSNLKNPNYLVDDLAKKSKTLLICHDNDEAGKKMFQKWERLYSHSIAYPTPIGKDIGEAVERDFNIREWIMEITK